MPIAYLLLAASLQTTPQNYKCAQGLSALVNSQMEKKSNEDGTNRVGTSWCITFNELGQMAG